MIPDADVLAIRTRLLDAIYAAATAAVSRAAADDAAMCALRQIDVRIDVTLVHVVDDALLPRTSPSPRSGSATELGLPPAHKSGTIALRTGAPPPPPPPPPPLAPPATKMKLEKTSTKVSPKVEAGAAHGHDPRSLVRKRTLCRDDDDNNNDTGQEDRNASAGPPGKRHCPHIAPPPSSSSSGATTEVRVMHFSETGEIACIVLTRENIWLLEVGGEHENLHSKSDEWYSEHLLLRDKDLALLASLGAEWDCE
ncbi:hypothetical protein BC828DRAFT_404729 [Blastocladiella britannica]|nr:hypothetical protein BC828DRAFT_404729 [Blastocladiella britannica]